MCVINAFKFICSGNLEQKIILMRALIGFVMLVLLQKKKVIVNTVNIFPFAIIKRALHREGKKSTDLHTWFINSGDYEKIFWFFFFVLSRSCIARRKMICDVLSRVFAITLTYREKVVTILENFRNFDRTNWPSDWYSSAGSFSFIASW